MFFYSKASSERNEKIRPHCQLKAMSLGFVLSQFAKRRIVFRISKMKFLLFNISKAKKFLSPHFEPRSYSLKVKHFSFHFVQIDSFNDKF